MPEKKIETAAQRFAIVMPDDKANYKYSGDYDEDTSMEIGVRNLFSSKPVARKLCPAGQKLDSRKKCRPIK